MTRLTTIGKFLAMTTLLATPLKLVAEEWIVPEKKLSFAAGLSPAIRAGFSAMELPDADKRRKTTFQSAEEWRAFANTLAAQNPATVESIEQLYKVQIEATQINGVKAYNIEAPVLNAAHKQHIFIHLHGGGYLLEGGASATKEGAAIASTSGIKVISVDYGLTPDHPFPAGLNDALAVYKEILKTHAASNIAIGGTSAGGGLTLALTHKLKALNLPLPGALFAGTPWTDLAATGDTIITNESIDNVLVTNEGFLNGMAKLYAGEHELTNPLISPYYGDFSQFPPTYLVSGTRDLLLSDTVRVHRKLRDANVTADLNVFEGLPHGGYMFAPDTPEFNGTFNGLAKFLLTHLASTP